MATFISALTEARTFLRGKPASTGRSLRKGGSTACIWAATSTTTRLDYVVRNLGTSTNAVSTQHINTRYGFGGGFFGDYADMSAGSDGIFDAFCTDINNVQNVVWWYALEFTPTIIHQQDVVTGSGNF